MVGETENAKQDESKAVFGQATANMEKLLESDSDYTNGNKVGLCFVVYDRHIGENGAFF